jgi:hypothetical protein
MAMFDDLLVISRYIEGLERHHERVRIIHTPPHSTIGGLACELVKFGPEAALIEWANGDRVWVPLDEISYRTR